MLRTLLRRLCLMPLILLIVHFASFSYALIAIQVQRASNPWGSSASGFPPIGEAYRDVLTNLLHVNLGDLPGSAGPMVSTLRESLYASLGLLIIAFLLSLLFGLSLGFSAVRIEPARIAGWLAPISAIGLAMPGFFVGSLFIIATLFYLLNAGSDARSLLPVSGFGWDEHLVIPVLALLVRPTAQIAQMTSALLVDELEKQYVTAARSVGNSWSSARWRHAFRNILAPLALGIASSLRWMIAECILVEWIFEWPGLGRLLAATLIPPETAGPGSLGHTSILFLFPPLLSALITLFSFAFLLTDILATSFAQSVDPRLAAGDREGFHG